jgi:flagellar basal body-associated protein FliL
MITLFDTEAQAMEKSLEHIPMNFGSQGRTFYSDMDIHIEIMNTNDQLEIYRNYFSLIDALSAVGG